MFFRTDRLSVGSGEFPRGDKMLYAGTDPESYIAKHILICADKRAPGVPPDTPWSRAESKSQVNLQQMPSLRGGICMAVD